MKVSNKFDVPSVYLEGVYYFPKDTLTNEKGVSIQGVYYDRYRAKWYQDTFYKSIEFCNEIINYAKSKGLET